MILAHQGGTSWDEILLVVVPLAVFTLLLFVARSRAGSLQHGDTDADTDRSANDDAPGA